MLCYNMGQQLSIYIEADNLHYLLDNKKKRNISVSKQINEILQKARKTK